MRLPHHKAAADGVLTAEQRAASRGFPVAIVNLLRKGSIDRDRSEVLYYSEKQYSTGIKDCLPKLLRSGCMHRL